MNADRVGMTYRLLAACLAAALACGHDPAPSPTPSPTPPDTGGSPPGNPPPANPPPAIPAPSNPAPGNPPPTNPPPPSDPSVTIKRLDDAAECDGLVPSIAPPAVKVHVDEASNNCGAGLSDGRGHVAIGSHFGRGFEEFQVFSPDGTPENRITAAMGFGTCFLATTCGPLFPQEEGFQAAATSGGTSSQDPLLVSVRTFASDGSLRGSVTPTSPDMGIFAWSLHEDPRGGTLLLATGLAARPAPGEKPCNAHDFRFGADGAQRGRGDFACHLVAGGVSTGGESLLLESADALHGTNPFDTLLQWQRPDGTNVGAPTAEATPFTFGAQLAPLLQGGLALNDGGRWTRRFPHLGATSEPVADWLASKTRWSFRFTRGNQGYALFPPPGQELVDCDPGVEIRSVSGRLCGTITFREEGGPCRTATIDQGWDGTVVQQSARDACSYRWWPKLLAKE